MSDEHAARVAWLVEQHLVMSQTAQRRDISDPETLRIFCELVGNQTRLDYLYLVTVADIAATSPKLWNSWKGSLLWELYTMTSRALSEGSSDIFDRDHQIRQSKSEVRERLLAQGLDSESVNTLWESLPEDVFLSYSREQLEWTAATVLDPPAGCPVLVAIREVEGTGCQRIAGSRTGLRWAVFCGHGGDR